MPYPFVTYAISLQLYVSRALRFEKTTGTKRLQIRKLCYFLYQKYIFTKKYGPLRHCLEGDIPLSQQTAGLMSERIFTTNKTFTPRIILCENALVAVFFRFAEYSNDFLHNSHSFKLASAFALWRMLKINFEETWGEPFYRRFYCMRSPFPIERTFFKSFQNFPFTYQVDNSIVTLVTLNCYSVMHFVFDQPFQTRFYVVARVTDFQLFI